MFLHRILQALGLQFLEGVDDAGTRVARLNNIINIAIACCAIGISKQVGIFSFFLLEECFCLFSFGNFDDLHRTKSKSIIELFSGIIKSFEKFTYISKDG